MSAYMRMRVYCTPVFKFHQLSKYFSKKIYFSDHVLTPATPSEHRGVISPLKITCKQTQAYPAVPGGRSDDAGPNKNGISP